jgi:dynein heavy chain
VIDQGGFYDVNKLFFKNVQDVVCAAACAPPGGGRNEVSPRLMRHFHMIWLTNLSSDSMCSIFLNILSGFLTNSLPSKNFFLFFFPNFYTYYSLLKFQHI